MSIDLGSMNGHLLMLLGLFVLVLLIVVIVCCAVEKSKQKWGYFIGVVNTAWSLVDDVTMIVTKPVSYIDCRGVRWDVSVGTSINGAGRYWHFRWIAPRYAGHHRQPSVFHDAFCKSRERPSWMVHRMFYEATRCRLAEISREQRKGFFWNIVYAFWNRFLVVKAWGIWLVTRVGGPRFSGNIVKDLNTWSSGQS